MNSLIKNTGGVFKKQFVKNVIIMASGTAAAQIIALIFTPMLTRIYGPEEFGVLGVFLSLVGIVLPLSALTYPVAIVLPKKDSEAKGLIRLSLYISFFMSTVTFLIFMISGNYLFEKIKMESISNYMLFIPISMFLGVCLQVVQQWMIRKKNYKLIAKVSIIQTLLVNLSKLVVGIFYPFALALISINVIGYALQALLLRLGLDNSAKKVMKIKEKQQKYTFNDLFNLAKKYSDFPRYRAPEVFVNAVSQSLPIIMLTILFTPAAAGFYTIAKKVLELPSQLIGRSVGDVFYPRVSEAYNNGENILSLLIKSTFSLILIGLVPFGIVIIFGPELFSLVFGEEWKLAGEYGRWLALLSYFAFINIPSVKTLPVISAQKFLLVFTLLSTILRLGALIVGSYIFQSDIIAIALFSLSGVVINIILIILTIIKSKKITPISTEF